MQSDEFALETFLPYLLNQAAEASSLQFETVYKAKYGMLRTEWRVLFHLGLYGQMTASEIAGRAKMHKTKISRAVHRLTERRMVVRDRDTDDRRVEHLTLTKSGKAAYDDLRSIAKRYEANLVAGMNDSEVDALRRVLMKLGEGRAKSFT